MKERKWNHLGLLRCTPGVIAFGEVETRRGGHFGWLRCSSRHILKKPIEGSKVTLFCFSSENYIPTSMSVPVAQMPVFFTTLFPVRPILPAFVLYCIVVAHGATFVHRFFPISHSKKTEESEHGHPGCQLADFGYEWCSCVVHLNESGQCCGSIDYNYFRLVQCNLWTLPYPSLTTLALEFFNYLTTIPWYNRPN